MSEAKPKRMTVHRALKISSGVFNSVVRATEMHDENAALVREVVMAGKPQIKVAAEAGTTRQNLNRLINIFWTAYDELYGLPADWKEKNVRLPADLWPKVEKLQAAALAKLNKDRAQKARNTA